MALAPWLTLDKRGRKFVCDEAAAHQTGVKREVRRHAHGIAALASGYLATQHTTRVRFHDLPPPRITVQRRVDVEYGDLDYYVCLEAEDRSPGLALGRVIGIEFGHEFESYERNTTGPWNRSGGTRILGRAVDTYAAFSTLAGA